MAGGSGTKEISSKYPCVDGIIAGTTTQTGHVSNLQPQNSTVPARTKKGL